MIIFLKMTYGEKTEKTGSIYSIKFSLMYSKVEIVGQGACLLSPSVLIVVDKVTKLHVISDGHDKPFCSTTKRSSIISKNRYHDNR